MKKETENALKNFIDFFAEDTDEALLALGMAIDVIEEQIESDNENVRVESMLSISNIYRFSIFIDDFLFKLKSELKNRRLNCDE
jgi:hypothetical protein